MKYWMGLSLAAGVALTLPSPWGTGAAFAMIGCYWLLRDAIDSERKP